MSTEGKRALIAAGRKVVFSGLVLIAVWLILLALRHVIPTSVIQDMLLPASRNGSNVISSDPNAWDWTRSLSHGTLVSQEIGDRVGTTIGLIALSGLMSFIMAGLLLYIGTLISSITKSPRWLVGLRRIIRLILISSGASIPVFVVSTMLTVFVITGWQSQQSAASLFEAAFYCSLLPAWLLIQTGQGIISNRGENSSAFDLTQAVGINLIIRLLKLVGLLIVATIPAEQFLAQPGLGRLFLESAFSRDFPVIFGVAWVLVLVVVAVKLAADLIEIANNYFTGQQAPKILIAEPETGNPGIPKGWLIFCLVLLALIILVAIAVPLLTPYGQNEIHLIDRLSPPSAKYMMGTDQLGRDIFSRLLYGIRIDVLSGLACALILSVIAASWGMLAAYCRKANNWIGDTLEDMVMLPKEIACSFPWLVLLLLILSMQENDSILKLVVICGLVLLPRAAGIVQESCRYTPDRKDWLQGILKSIPLVIIFTTAAFFVFSSNVSYLGFGMPPGIPELGNIMSSEGLQYMRAAPWILWRPALTLVVLITVWVMTGDSLLERLGFRSKAIWAKTME